MAAPTSDLPRRNCWTIAEWAGERTPHGMQHLLCRASWDADAVRDDVREYVVEHLFITLVIRPVRASTQTCGSGPELEY